MTMKLHIYQEVHVCGTGTEGGCMLYKTHQIQFLRLKEIVLLLLYSTVLVPYNLLCTIGYLL